MYVQYFSSGQANIWMGNISEFEGERISHLDKLRDYKLAKQEEAKEKKEQQMQDDYVLHRLFKKTGTVLLH